ADLINDAGYDVRIVGSAGLPLARLPVVDAGKLVEQIRQLPEVAASAIVRTEPAVVTQPNHPAVGLELIGTTDFKGEGIWKLERGAGLPATPNVRSADPPVVISNALAGRLSLAVG